MQFCFRIFINIFLLLNLLSGIQMSAMGTQGTWPSCSFGSCNTNNLNVIQVVIAGPDSPTQAISSTSPAYIWAQIDVPSGNKIRKNFYFIGNLIKKEFGQTNFVIVQPDLNSCMEALVGGVRQCWITADTGIYWFRAKNPITNFPWGAQEVRIDPLTISWQTSSGQGATNCNCPAPCNDYPDGQCWRSSVSITLANPSSLGDRVWHDLNANGIQEVDEPGISGVTVNLYRSDVLTPLSTATTITNGLYHFQNLPAGNYFVEFKPAGYQFSPADQGTNDNLDSDANIVTGRTEIITLVSGVDDISWDSGMYKLGKIIVTKVANPKDSMNFIFTTDIPSYLSIALDDDSDPILPNSLEIPVLPGIYTIAEDAVIGWGLGSIAIGDPTGDSTFDMALRSALLHIRGCRKSS